MPRTQMLGNRIQGQLTSNGLRPLPQGMVNLINALGPPVESLGNGVMIESRVFGRKRKKRKK